MNIHVHLTSYRDVAVMDTDGMITIRGRQSDQMCFYVRRFGVWPSIVESIVSTHPHIEQIKVCH